MQPAGSGPFYMPGVPNCPPQTFRFYSKGGYAPVTWHHSGPLLNMEQKNSLGSSAFELINPTGQTGTSPAPATLPLKPASPSTRLLWFAASWGGGGVPGFSLAMRLTVQAVDGSGQTGAAHRSKSALQGFAWERLCCERCEPSDRRSDNDDAGLATDLHIASYQFRHPGQPGPNPNSRDPG